MYGVEDEEQILCPRGRNETPLDPEGDFNTDWRQKCSRQEQVWYLL